MILVHHHPVAVRTTLRRRMMIGALYVRALLAQFRLTLLVLIALIVIAAVLHRMTPADQLPDNQQCSVGDSIYAAWMALLAQPQYSKCPWYLKVIYALYPVTGLVLIGEGVVRLALLILSKQRGEKEWMLVVASTHRDHVILCGLGHLGFRVLEQLAASNVPTVVLEKSANNPFIVQVKAMKVPILIRDMKEDAALIDAGVEHASAIIICSNDQMTNIEVALDARRMNANVRVIMRMFDQKVASKISDALAIDDAFSSSALAAPVIAAMAFQTRVLATLSIGGTPYVTAEMKVEGESSLAGKTLAEVETLHGVRVLARTPADGAVRCPSPPSEAIVAGDVLLVHVAAAGLPVLAVAGRRTKG
jgi:Trk K+ transport system NAD-binding subunit